MIFLDIVQFEVFSRCVNLCAIIFYHSGSGIKFAKHFHRFCCQFEWLEASFQNARLLETLMKVRDKNPGLIKQLNTSRPGSTERVLSKRGDTRALCLLESYNRSGKVQQKD